MAALSTQTGTFSSPILSGIHSVHCSSQSCWLSRNQPCVVFFPHGLCESSVYTGNPLHEEVVIACIAFWFGCRALGADDRRAELQYWSRSLRYSCAFTLPVFMLAMVLPMMPGCEALFQAHLLGFPLDELLKWAFATPVQFWIGWRFHAGAWKALKNGR